MSSVRAVPGSTAIGPDTLKIATRFTMPIAERQAASIHPVGRIPGTSLRTLCRRLRDSGPKGIACHIATLPLVNQHREIADVSFFIAVPPREEVSYSAYSQRGVEIATWRWPVSGLQ
jgi:hypothetical protein